MSIMEASTKILEIPALERDFREGALYDARNEQMVLGYSLWNADDVEKIKARRNDGTHYLMNASDTLSEKFSGVKMSASAQLSILSGLIELGGSVSYLKKEINTLCECSVQVKCFYKTGYKEMSMDQIRNIRYLDIARNGHNNRATHFVMKIQYGAGAIFTFTKKFEKDYEEEEVKAELQVSGEKILNLLDGSVEGSYRNYSSSSQIKCEFESFGLSLSDALPTTYDEAVKFAGNFGRMAHRSVARQGGEALGIPCIVWLHPLVLLPGCADAPKLYWDFTPDQASEWVKFFEDCDTFEKKIDYSLQIFASGASSFLNIIRNLLIVDDLKHASEDDIRLKKKFINQLRSDSTKTLRETIIKIRSGLTPIGCFNKEMSYMRAKLHLGIVKRKAKKKKE